jgi:multiple sugar transport system ATP-binding protein
MSHAESGQSLTISKLRKDFGEVRVLHDITAEAAAGEFLVLVGPSGCGKSTLLNCIAGLETITSGSVSIGGRDVSNLPPKDRDIAMVFQSYALYPTMSVQENMAFGMKVRRRPQVEITEKVTAAARLLQIEHLLDRKPSQLSGGQRQRVAMGRALVRNPALFLFDEPLSNLDAKLRLEMRAEIKRLHEATGTTIVYVTHDQIEAMTLATKIVVLKDGYVQQIGTPREIYERPANTFVAEFMGSPPMNILDATVESGRLVLADGQSIALPDTAPASVATRGKVLIGIRPEVLTAGTDITVTPRLIEHTGADTFVMFDMGGRSVTARLSHKDTPDMSGVGLALPGVELTFFDAETGVRLNE